MSAPPVADERAWLATQVAEYEKLHPRYKQYADLLAQVLVAAARELAPLAIVQARAKAIASFAEKALRKKDKYADPVHEFTDLCGGRVIARTRSEVQEFCRFIEAHFAIDQDNSCDASQRLKPTEFGYRSIHYIVSFRPGTIRGLAVPEAVLGLRAEVQVRTLVEHAYADFGHDLTYKGAFALPAALERELAGAAANLEEVDQTFSRVEERVRAFATSYGKYLTGAALDREAVLLEIIVEYDLGNAGLAERLGKLAITREDWAKAIAVLSRHVDDAHPERAPVPVLCDLGVALCKSHEPDSPGFARGQRYLEIAVSGERASVDALCSLAGTYKGRNEDRVRELYRRAFHLDPADPYALGNHLEAELGRGVPVLETARPLIAKAMERCEAHIAAGVNLPWALYDLGKFHLLVGDPYAGLDAYAKAIELSSAEWMVETSLRSLERLGDVGRGLPGHEWIRRLLLLGSAVRFGGAAAIERVRRLATAGCPPLRPPVRIVTGGTAADVEADVRAYADLFITAFAGFEGTVISGGTTQGVCGLVGDAAQRYRATHPHRRATCPQPSRRVPRSMRTGRATGRSAAPAAATSPRWSRSRTGSTLWRPVSLRRTCACARSAAGGSPPSSAGSPSRSAPRWAWSRTAGARRPGSWPISAGRPRRGWSRCRGTWKPSGRSSAPLPKPFRPGSARTSRVPSTRNTAPPGWPPRRRPVAL